MFKLSFAPPSTCEFENLRSSIGWKNCASQVTSKSIENTLFWASFYDGKELAATGRIIGDGAMYFYIQDVIVAPKFQGCGLGKSIMEHIEKYLHENASQHATVGLLAAKGKEGFYEKYDYIIRDGQELGQALCKFVK